MWTSDFHIGFDYTCSQNKRVGKATQATFIAIVRLKGQTYDTHRIASFPRTGMHRQCSQYIVLQSFISSLGSLQIYTYNPKYIHRVCIRYLPCGPVAWDGRWYGSGQRNGILTVCAWRHMAFQCARFSDGRHQPLWQLQSCFDFFDQSVHNASNTPIGGPATGVPPVLRSGVPLVFRFSSDTQKSKLA
jgi:hypothetical protein